MLSAPFFPSVAPSVSELDLRLAVEERPSDALLAGLTEAQHRAVTAPGGPVVVLAAAGSGKTRVLTRRIARRILDDETDPNRVLALTFTRKAAGELRHRLSTLGLRDGVHAGTFHSVALLQLRQRWAERNVDPPAMVRSKTRLIGSLLPSGSIANRRQGPRVGSAALDAAAEIDWARARLLSAEDYPAAAAAAGRTTSLSAEVIADLLVGYQQLKRRKRVVDFDDLLELARRDLLADPDYAAAIRWRYRHLYVDEFQDVNPLQFDLLRQWRGGRNDLFVVGDPDQAIYGWNGSDPDLLADFAAREPSATVIELRENHRSTPQIVAVAAALTDGSGLDATRPDGPVPTIDTYPDDSAEAAGIARRIVAAHDVAGGWSDQAVVTRTNAQLAPIERALIDAGVPVRLRSGAGPLGAPEVRAELRRLTDPATDLAAAADDLDALLTVDLDRSSITEIERRSNLGALARLLREYLDGELTPTGPGLAAWLDTIRGDDVDGDTDAVELTTFHGAKGLEWEVVHLAGLEDGFVPIAYATTGAQLAEERRLLYVAVTRARSELHLSWAEQRTFTSHPVGRAPSPLLGWLTEAIRRLGVGPIHRVDWQARLAETRDTLAAARGAAPRPGGDPILDALVEWRRRRARAADVPPHVVLGDRALRALAAERPTTRSRLAAVSGLGPAKLARFGDELLQLLAERER